MNSPIDEEEGRLSKENSPAEIKLIKCISDQWVEENIDLQLIEKLIPLSEVSTQANEYRDLNLEFKLLKRITETAKHQEILIEYDVVTHKLNRYLTIMPFKHTLVDLTDEKEMFGNSKQETYINANYIDGFNHDEKKTFIATQGPKKETCSHYWRMAWLNNSNVVITLCLVQENGKVQCDPFWEENTTFDFRVTQVSCEKKMNGHIIHRTLEILHIDSQQKKMVNHYQLVTWPDKTAPSTDTIDAVIYLIEICLAERLDKNKSAPIIVNCSAGLGRTGTFICMYHVYKKLKHFAEKRKLTPSLEEAKLKEEISIFHIARNMREQRWGLVHNELQYSCLYSFCVSMIKYFNLDQI